MIKLLTFLLLISFTHPSHAQSTNIDSTLTIILVSSDLNKFQNVRDFCHSHDENEAYFSIQSPNQELSQIVCVKNNDWAHPQLLPFCDAHSYLEPFLSNDGLKLYFASDRPKTSKKETKSDYDIWYVTRKDFNSDWSAPINMGSPVNSENNEFYPTLSYNNNLYFTMEAKDGLGKDDIYYCNWNGKSYSKPVLLSKNINSEGYEFNAFISNDEQFLIYTKYNAQGGVGSGDLYVSKKNAQGEWQPAQHLGTKINTKYMEYCPFYHASTNTLYFTSKRTQLSAKTFNNLEEYLEYISGSENGASKIYKCQLTF